MTNLQVGVLATHILEVEHVVSTHAISKSVKLDNAIYTFICDEWSCDVSSKRKKKKEHCLGVLSMISQ